MEEDADKEAIDNIIAYLSGLERINGFVFVMNSEDPRFDGNLVTILRKLCYIFSNRFLNNTIIVFTHWENNQ